MKKATHIKDYPTWNSHASLYKLEDEVTYGWNNDKKTKYVIVSAAMVPFSGPETYIFPATKDGEIIEWLEIDGSVRGELDHSKALNIIGYEIVYDK